MKFEFADILEETIQAKKLYKNPTLSLQDLALEFGTNRTYLSQYINRQLHTTYFDFINGFRVRHAEKLMLEEYITLTVVCERSGFNSISTFHRAFRRVHGCTPSEYRKNILGQ